MILSEIMEILNRIAPLELSEDWDNCGLQVGDPFWNVKKIVISLDVSENVVQFALDKGADLIISHHPLIFSPLKSIKFNSSIGSIIYKAATEKISIYSAHTNLDSANGGLNDILSEMIGLKNLSVLGEKSINEDGSVSGIGRIGSINKPATLLEFSNSLIKNLNLKNLRFSGNEDHLIEKAAVCTGSGSSLISDFLKSDCQVFVTGDMKYHEAQRIIENGKSLIDIGHFASEHIVTDAFKDILKKELPKEIEIISCNIEKDPFNTLLSQK